VLGKTFEEGDLQISVTGTFYHEKTCDAKSAKRLVRSATIVNAVGKDIVNILLKEKLVDKNNVLTVKGVLHAQMIKI